MFTKELIGKVKDFKKEKYAAAKRAESKGAATTVVNQIRGEGNRAVGLLDAYSCLHANALCKSYPESTRAQFMELAEDRYQDLVNLIGL